jgi:ribonuclease J
MTISNCQIQGSLSKVGVHEIGGNKFLVEDKGTRVFLDFGNQVGKEKEYFSEYLQPRALNGT